MQQFKKYFIIPAPPESIYIALTNEATATLWTGDKATIQPIENGVFSLWDDAILGHFLALEPPHKIVQEWYFGESEPASIVTIKLHPHKKGTSMEIIHTNIPDEAYDDMVEGWEDPFIASLIDFYTED